MTLDNLKTYESGSDIKSSKKEKSKAKISTEKKPVELVSSKKGEDKSKGTQIGTARAIESMFKNSYRAQLDMIALAATKANIMISLNGLLVSVLLVSGAYFFRVEPMLIIPFATFLLTCTIAIVFAVLAARPVVIKGEHSLHDFRTDRADLLIFEQFSALPKEDYVDAMFEMIRDNKRIYRNMIVHIYKLGRSADRKFARLYISYNVFMTGLVISVLLLLSVIARSVFSGV